MLNVSSRENLKIINLCDEVEQNLKKKVKYAFVKVRKMIYCFTLYQYIIILTLVLLFNV